MSLGFGWISPLKNIAGIVETLEYGVWLKLPIHCKQPAYKPLMYNPFFFPFQTWFLFICRHFGAKLFLHLSADPVSKMGGL